MHGGDGRWNQSIYDYLASFHLSVTTIFYLLLMNTVFCIVMMLVTLDSNCGNSYCTNVDGWLYSII